MKAMNIAEKILARSAGKTQVSPGELIWCKVDRLMTHDPCSPGVIGIFDREFGPEAKIWDLDRYILIADHFVYTTDTQANNNLEKMRNFADRKAVRHFYDVGTPDYKGVCHVALAEGGHSRPGELMVGTDSHTVTAGAFGTFAIGVGNTDAALALGTGEILLKVPASIRVEFKGTMPAGLTAKDLILKLVGDLGVAGATYCALEFGGSVIENMSLDERMTLCNMAIECGAKTGLMEPNQAALQYLEERNISEFKIIQPDDEAEYQQVIEYDITDMEPQVAKPSSPDNVVPISELEGQEVDRVYLGSCTGGKLEDFLRFAEVVAGQKVAVETYAVPATQEVLRQIIIHKVNGISIYECLIEAGVKVATFGGCAACCGGPKDTFGRVNEAIRVVSTTNRNFPGRMGHKEASVYLASPITSAQVALTGSFSKL